MLRALAMFMIVFAVGCVRDNRFDPLGCDLHLQGEWTVNGNPPDETTCGQIAEVELFIWNEDVSETFSSPSRLRFKCQPTESNGAGVQVPIDPPFLDTTQNDRRCKKTGRLLKDGTYQGQWVAFTEFGLIVDCAGPRDIGPIVGRMDDATTLEAVECAVLNIFDRGSCPGATIEVFTPDFDATREASGACP